MTVQPHADVRAVVMPEPAPEFPGCRMDGTTELRIHGVSGTPVEAMLHHPHPVKVSGAGHAGCFRRGDDHAVASDIVPPDRDLEAYSWGGLTSGSSLRALWLLLVPFTFANVASWMHPVRPRKTFAPVGWMSGFIRAFSLTLTLTFVVATAGVGMDLVAWQCANDPVCGRRFFFTRFMTNGDAFWTQPGVRVAVGALLPLALLALLRWLSHSTSRAYEEYGCDPDTERRPSAPADSSSGSGAEDFANEHFWSGGKPFGRLRALHTGAAAATIAGLVSYAAQQGDRGAWAGFGAALPWAAALVVALCMLATLLPVSGRRRELLEGKEPPRWARVPLAYSEWVGGALLLAAVIYAVGPADPDISASTELPGVGGTISVLLVGQFALLGAYFLANVAARVRSPDTPAGTLLNRTLFLSFGGPVLALTALGIAGAYASGLVFRVADYLGKPVVNCEASTCVQGRAAEMVVHWTYYLAARTFTVAAVVALAVGVSAWLWLRARHRRCRAVVEREYGRAPGDQPERVREIAKAQAAASLTDRADLLIAAFVLPVLAGQVALWWLAQVDEEHALLSATTTAGTWLTGLFALGLILIGRSAYGSGSSRRIVGILWDLGTFWPRAAHPFAPPCYCERVVPEFSRRVERLTENGKVVISAHSQGSLIAAAAIHRLGPGKSGKVGLVTYGSPLERLYARLFPHFFGLDELRAVRSNVGDRWRNLYRRTDPIGGPVFSLDRERFTCRDSQPPQADPVDVRFRDPAWFDTPDGEFFPPRPRGHSDYWDDAAFAPTITAVAEAIPDPARSRVAEPGGNARAQTPSRRGRRRPK